MVQVLIVRALELKLERVDLIRKARAESKSVAFLCCEGRTLDTQDISSPTEDNGEIDVLCSIWGSSKAHRPLGRA